MTAETKHTAGPWIHEGHGDITGIENDPDNGCVGKVDVCSVYLRTVQGRHEANARLIAAAPELLEALQAIKDRLDTSPTHVMYAFEVFDSFYQELINKAIAKVTGETQ